MIALAQALAVDAPGPAPRYSVGIDVSGWFEHQFLVDVGIVLAVGALAYLACLAVVTFVARSEPTSALRAIGTLVFLALGLRVLLGVLVWLVRLRLTILYQVNDPYTMDDTIATPIIVLLTIVLVPLIIAVAFAVGMGALRGVTLGGTRAVNSARRESPPVTVATLVPVAIVLLFPPTFFPVAFVAVPVWVVGTVRASRRVHRILPCRMPESVCLVACASLHRGDTCARGLGSGQPGESGTRPRTSFP